MAGRFEGFWEKERENKVRGGPIGERGGGEWEAAAGKKNRGKVTGCAKKGNVPDGL